MKKIWKSATLWANLIAAIGLFLQAQYGWIITPEIQAGILAALNVVLRFKTNEPIGR